MSDKSQWGSKLGFILAAAGSAIGLGAVWKFPYMVAGNGGGVFLLIFLVATLLIGFPLLIAEFVLGRAAGTAAIHTFGKLGGRSSYNFIGWLGAFALFILLTFYSVIGGWILIYLGMEIAQLFQLITISDYANFFNQVIANPWLAVGSQGLFILLNILIVSKGVEKGIERASKVMMPLLFLIFLVIIIRSLTLPGAMEGVRYFLEPDFSRLTSEGILYALGQSFFALSLGVTAMLTYASYLDRETRLVPAGVSIVSMNIAVSIMAGLAIFPAMAAFQIPSSSGPGLLFVVLPQVFEQMAFGSIFYILFLLLFLFATVSSSVVMLEINVANVTKQDNRKRTKWSWILGIITFIVGIPSALSYGIFSHWSLFGLSFFDALDYLVSNLLMPIGALCLSLFSGFILKGQVAQAELHLEDGADWKIKLFHLWIFLLRYLIPLVIIIVLITQLLG